MLLLGVVPPTLVGRAAQPKQRGAEADGEAAASPVAGPARAR